MDSGENCPVSEIPRRRASSRFSRDCCWFRASRAARICCSRRRVTVLPGFSSCKSSEMFWMDSPASRRKQMIRSRFKSSSEYSRRPPSDNALGTRMFLES